MLADPRFVLRAIVPVIPGIEPVLAISLLTADLPLDVAVLARESDLADEIPQRASRILDPVEQPDDSFVVPRVGGLLTC